MHFILPQRVRKIILAFLHGFFMILLVFVWLRQPYIFDYEFEFTKDIIDLENYLRIGNHQKKEKYLSKFYFINTSHSLVLDENASYKEANVKTDRLQLLNFLERVEKHPDLYECILFDVFIERLETKTDTLLYQVIQRLKAKQKITTVNLVSEQNLDYANHTYSKIESNALGEKLSGTIYYPMSSEDAYYKFYYQFKPDKGERHKQLPMIAYECITKTTAESPFCFDVFYCYDNQPGLYQNIYIPRNIINYDDIVLTSNNPECSPVNTSNLSWIFDDEESIVTILKNKPKPILVVGDVLWGDLHYSTSGLIRGPLIGVNALISLLEQENRMHLSYLLFLWIAFSLISYFTFYPRLIRKAKNARIKKTWLSYIRHFFIHNLNYIILILTTIIGIFFFEHYIYFFFNLTYIYLVRKIYFLRKAYLISRKRVKLAKNATK